MIDHESGIFKYLFFSGITLVIVFGYLISYICRIKKKKEGFIFYFKDIYTFKDIITEEVSFKRRRLYKIILSCLYVSLMFIALLIILEIIYIII